MTGAPAAMPPSKPAGRYSRNALLALLVSSAVAPYAGLDAWRLGIPFVYAPRILLAVAALLVAAAALRRRHITSSATAAICAGLFVHCLGWGDGQQKPGETELALLSLNVHNKATLTETLPALVARESVDILTLQELRLNNRAKFVAALPDFAFYWVEPEQMPERKSSGVFASAIAIRRSRLAGDRNVEVAVGITDYRTFAVKAELDGRPLWIVSVHATKPFWTEDGVLKMIVGAASKARWHQQEADALATWLYEHADTPIVAAGDFNTPYYARNIANLKLGNAHLAAGRGPHLTFPAALPVWGIDHVLGNSRVTFSNYRLLAAPPSDHRAQIARFGVDH